MNLIKTKDGNYQPAYPSDWEESKKIPVGTEVRATKDRNPKFHRKMFALLSLLFENQDKYTNIDIYRQILTIKAGYVNWIDGSDGIKYPFAESWSFDKMSQEKFEKLYKAVLEIGSKEIGMNGDAIEAELNSFY